MNVRRFVCTMSAVLLSTVAYGQTASQPAVHTDAQASFALMKTLAGTWQGTVTTDNPAWATDKPMPLSIRVASHGNALVHELDTGGPEETVFYMEGDRLAMLHYCDFGNRPHMVAQPLKDGKVIEFDLVEYPGSDQIGHVSHGTFTILDPNHHVEDWTFLPTGGKPVHAHIDFKRVP